MVLNCIKNYLTTLLIFLTPGLIEQDDVILSEILLVKLHQRNLIQKLLWLLEEEKNQ